MADSVEKLHKQIFNTNLGVVSPLPEGRSSIVGRSERSIFYTTPLKLHRASFSTESTQAEVARVWKRTLNVAFSCTELFASSAARWGYVCLFFLMHSQP